MRTVEGSLLVSLTLFACSCGTSEARPTVDSIEHPTAENLPAEADVTAILTETNSKEDHRLRHLGTLWRERLAGLREVWSIGSVDGKKREEAFSRIVDVAFDGDDRLAVLDRTLGRVRLFRMDGSFVSEFGGPPTTPLRDAEILEYAPRRGMVILDRVGHQPLKLFKPHAGSYELAKAINVDVMPEDMCHLNDRLFVAGLLKSDHAKGTVHEVTVDGDVRGSFGKPYAAQTSIARIRMSQALIACAEATDTVLVAPKRLPFVFGYAPDGKPKWVMKLAAFLSPRITERPAVGGYNVSGQEPFDLPIRVVTVSDGIVLLQISRVNRAARHITINSYLLDSRQGVGLFVGSTLPVVAAIRWPFVAGIEKEPYERVVIYSSPHGER